jgi:predicted nucleic acid-binding protein
MAFWDTSALVPLCVQQSASKAFRRLVGEHRRIVVWWGTPVEIRSALARLQREKAITPDGLAQTLERFNLLRRSWAEVLPTDRLRALAEVLPERHGVRAPDAFQLAAALIWCNEKPKKRPFVCPDQKLAASAEAAGFSVSLRPFLP